MLFNIKVRLGEHRGYLTRSMPRRNPIQTSIGLLTYRDCIFLDSVELPSLNSLLLAGELNATVITDYCAPPGWEAAEDVPFQLRFHSVLGFQMLELDTWHDQNSSDESHTESSFDEILDSSFIARMRGHGTKLGPDHRHFQCFTYDDVFDIVATSFTLLTGNDARTQESHGES